MADQQRHGDRGPLEEGNGGPVLPGAGPPHGTRPDRSDRIAGDNGENGENGENGGTRGGPPALRDQPDIRRDAPKVKEPRSTGLWAGLILSTLMLVFLLVFIVQNLDQARIRFLGAEGTLPVGVALLFAAAVGILLVAIPGYLRILQLRRMIRRRDTGSAGDSSR